MSNPAQVAVGGLMIIEMKCQHIARNYYRKEMSMYRQNIMLNALLFIISMLQQRSTFYYLNTQQRIARNYRKEKSMNKSQVIMPLEEF